MARIEGGCLYPEGVPQRGRKPVFVGVCHCADCQRLTGSAFAAVVAGAGAGAEGDGNAEDLHQPRGNTAGRYQAASAQNATPASWTRPTCCRASRC